MKNLTLYTQGYEQALREYLHSGSNEGWLSVKRTGTREGQFFTVCAYDSASVPMADALVLLLEQTAAEENPIYRHSAKLQALARQLRQKPVHAENLRRLTQYLRENRVLHLEGYVFFRMAEYRGQLDALMFSVIKKINITQPL